MLLGAIDEATGEILALTAMRQPRGPFGLEPSLQPARLAQAQAQGLGRLTSGDPTGAGSFHQPRGDAVPSGST
jgi:hypothetical protein